MAEPPATEMAEQPPQEAKGAADAQEDPASAESGFVTSVSPPDDAAEPASSSSPPGSPAPRPSRERRPSISQAMPSRANVRESVAEVLGVLDVRNGRTIEELETFSDAEFAAFVAQFEPRHIKTFVDAGRAAGWIEEKVSLSFRNLFYKRDGKVLLNGVSGYVRPGEMVAVMGPGATTFFHVLAARQHGGRVSGEVLVNQRPPDEGFERAVGYVTKDDNHLPLLTVRETIRVSSELRSPVNLPPVVRNLRVELVMKMLGIAHVADSVVGDANIRGISGGEKRRLSLALEIVAGHPVLLMDLPTNGLDSATSLDFVRTSRHAAEAGGSIMMSVVQASPELFEEFDNVLCLCRNSVVYFGPPHDAVHFFESCGFVRPHGKSYPDFLTEVLDTPERFYAGPVNLSRSSLPELEVPQAGDREVVGGGGGVTYRQAWDVMLKRYEDSDEHTKLGDTLWKDLRPQFELEEEVPPPRFNTAVHEQLGAVLKRQMAITYRNRTAFVGGIVRSVVLGLLVGTLFFQLGESVADARARMGLLFFAMISQVSSAFQGVPNIVKERGIFYEQAAAGYYRRFLFWCSYEAASLPFALLEGTIFVVLVYGLTGLRGGLFGAEFWFFFLTVYLTGLVARAYVFTVAMAAPDVVLAQAVVPAIFVVLMLVSGYLIPFDSIPAGWQFVYYLSFMSYPMRALAINELTGLTFDCPANESCFGPPQDVDSTFPGEDVLKFYDMDAGSESYKWTLFGYSMLLFVAFNVAATLATVYVDHSGEVDDEQRPDNAGAVDTSSYEGTSRRTTAGAVSDNAGVIEFHNLCYSVPVPNPTPKDGRGKTVQRKLLTDVSGYAVPGRMIALMGASGAGKSTLLDVLAGKKTGGELGGSLLVNGQPRDEFFARFAGYVEQFDSHDPNTTVREAVEFSARLRLPASVAEDEIARRVDSVLEELDLTEAADSTIGGVEGKGISPELRKKVTIAVELVMRPGILFLDEPTTGLTSASAMSVMTATRKLADRISVLCTIHQPSNEVIQLFDWILLLQPGGRTVYFGALDGLPDYLERNGFGRPAPGANIADFALEALKQRSADLQRHKVMARTAGAGAGADADADADADAKDPEEQKRAPEDPADTYLGSDECADAEKRLGAGVAPKDRPPPAYTERYAASFSTQFRLLLERFVRSDLREQTGLSVRMISATFMGLVVGTIFFDLGDVTDSTANTNRVSVCFFVVTYMYFSAQVTLAKYAYFRPIYFREQTNSMYSSFTFYCARTLSDVPISLLATFVFSTLVYWMTNVVPEDRGVGYGKFLAIMWITNLTGGALTDLLGGLGSTAEVGTAFAGLFTTIFMVFTGFLAPRDVISDAWIWLYYANPVRFSLFYLIQLALNTGEDGDALMGAFDVDPDKSSLYIGVSAGFLVAFRLLAYVVMRYVNHVKR